jgi:hypothetical protein
LGQNRQVKLVGGGQDNHSTSIYSNDIKLNVQIR